MRVAVAARALAAEVSSVPLVPAASGPLWSSCDGARFTFTPVQRKKRADQRPCISMSKVKKAFDKPGQTMEHDETQPDGPAGKIFYETLMQQRPDSAMAAEWLLKRGLLEDKDAKMWQKKLGKDKPSKPAPGKRVRRVAGAA